MVKRRSLTRLESEITARWPIPSRHSLIPFNRENSNYIAGLFGTLADCDNRAPIIPPIFPLFDSRFLAVEDGIFLKKKKKVNRSASSSNLERSWKLFQAFHGWTDSSSSGGCCGGVNQRWPLSFPSTEYSRLFFRETRLLNHRITSSAGAGGGDFSRTTRKNNNHG